MTNTDAAWLAGIIDGEGCITITRQAPGTDRRKNWSYRLYVKVTMGHEPTVRRIATLVGCGAVTTWKPLKHNRSWTWWAASREALAVLTRIRPYLITKAEEADIAAEWGRLPLSPRGGSRGSRETPPDLLAARHSLFIRLREVKPGARFRAAIPAS